MKQVWLPPDPDGFQHGVGKVLHVFMSTDSTIPNSAVLLMLTVELTEGRKRLTWTCDQAQQAALLSSMGLAPPDARYHPHDAVVKGLLGKHVWMGVRGVELRFYGMAETDE